MRESSQSSKLEHIHLILQRRPISILFIGFILVFYMLWVAVVWHGDKTIDFYVYYLAAETFSRGQDAYTIGGEAWRNLAAELQITNFTSPYYYPPLTAQVVWPLTALSPRLAALLWLLISVGAFLASAFWLGRSSEHWWGVWLALLLCVGFVPVLTTLYAGQVNALLLLALCGAFYALGEQKWIWAGVVLACGAMLKIIPLVHIGYLFWRRWWLALWSSFALIMILILLAWPFVGSQSLLGFAQILLSKGGEGSLVQSGANVALSGFIGRMFGPSTGAILLWRGLSLLMVAITMALCWPKESALSRIYQLEFALITVAINVIMPYTWYHQLALLLVPLFVLADWSLSGQVSSRIWLFLGPLYALCSVHGLIWHQLEAYALLVSMPFYLCLALWLTLAWQIWQIKWANQVAR